uniref:Uncharacterized protein n=1 Tax=Oryzias latipes TaxID=8090 RepID=A0A3P9HQF4_ORYLA
MAESLLSGKLDESKFTCSICLDLLKEPVTIPCGHSYCMSCIESHWNVEDFRMIYSCPECRHTFQPRPALRKNTVLAGLVEDLKRTGGQEAPHSDRSAGPGDVPCDFCTGRKLKAIKSCLQCLVSYCELHLQPHYESPTFQKHKLVEASPNIQENICSLHNSTKEIFCRSDQELICYHCSVENHQGHNTTSAVMERTTDRDSQTDNNHRPLTYFEKLTAAVFEVTQKFHDVLKQEWTKISQSEVDVLLTHENEDTLNSMLACHLPKGESIASWPSPAHSSNDDLKISPATPITQSQNGFSGSWAQLYLFGQESVTCSDLPRMSPESAAPLPLASIDQYPKKPMDSECSTVSSYSKKHSTSPSAQPSSKSPDDRLPFAINPPRKETMPLHATPVYLSPHEPKTTTDFLQYSCQITLDPNTMNKSLTLSGENRRVTREKKKQRLFNHAERFADQFQVLSRESLTGRCYWEVEWNGMVSVAVSYNNINRKGQGSGFGENDKSWALYCHNNKFIHNSMYTVLTSSPSSRVGVYLDYKAGILCFYSVAETRTLLHRVETKFAHPLHAGLCVNSGAAEIIQLR